MREGELCTIFLQNDVADDNELMSIATWLTKLANGE
jgi:hypothetical protein